MPFNCFAVFPQFDECQVHGFFGFIYAESEFILAVKAVPNEVVPEENFKFFFIADDVVAEWPFGTLAGRFIGCHISILLAAAVKRGMKVAGRTFLFEETMKLKIRKN